MLGRRTPCPSCGERIRTTAAVCPACGLSARVNLRVLRPMKDAKARYKLAREILENHRLVVRSFEEVSHALQTGQVLLAKDILHSDAVILERMLVGQLVACSIEPAQSRKGDSTLPKRWILLVVALGVIVAAVGTIAFVLTRST